MSQSTVSFKKKSPSSFVKVDDQHLPFYRQDQLERLNFAAGFFNNDQSPLSALGSIETLLKKYLGSQSKVRFIKEKWHPNFVDSSLIKQNCFALGFRFGFSDTLCYLFLPNNLASILTAKILGREFEGQKTDFFKLTPIEESLIEFLVLEVLNEQAHLTREKKNQLSLAKIFNQTDDLINDSQEVKGALALDFVLDLKDSQQNFFIVFPDSLIASIKENREWRNWVKLSQANQKKKWLNSFDYLLVALDLAVAHVELTPAEIFELNPGDIVLFDEFLADFDGKRVSGLAKLSCREAKNNSILVKIKDSASNFELKLESLEKEY